MYAKNDKNHCKMPLKIKIKQCESTTIYFCTINSMK